MYIFMFTEIPNKGDIWFIITILLRTEVVSKSTPFVCLSRRHMFHVKFKSTLILFETSNKERWDKNNVDAV